MAKEYFYKPIWGIWKHFIRLGQGKTSKTGIPQNGLWSLARPTE